MKLAFHFAALCVLLFVSSIALCSSSPQDLKTQISALDAEIKEFQTARDQYAMKAYVAGNKADQIMDEDWLAYKRELALQAEYQQDVIWLDQKIKALQKQRDALQAQLDNSAA